MNLLIKIFLPKHLYKISKSVNLYGHIVCNDNIVIFYIIDTCDNNDLPINLLGKIIFGVDDDDNDCPTKATGADLNTKHHVIFTTQQNTTIQISKITINNSNVVNGCEIFWVLYDLDNIRYVSATDFSGAELRKQNDDVLDLVKFVQLNNTSSSEIDGRSEIWERFKNFSSRFAIFSPLLKPVEEFVKDSTISIHFLDWIRCFKSSRRRTWTHIFDSLAGILIIALLLWNYQTPGEYFMKIAIYLVRNIQALLEKLGGNPAGLKLNSQLNQFLLDLFQYHADMWIKFLHIVSPAINYLFVLGFVGILGFSFQLALLSDILVIVTLYAHCFYVYATLLYHIEIMGLKALWRVVLGRRYNTLKKRVESYNYSNAQLYLATLFFAGLLFLLPTISVYYIVFASIRFIIYCITSTLLKIRRKLLILPMFEYIQWIFGNYSCLDNIEIKLVDMSQPILSKLVKIPVQTIEIELKQQFPRNSNRDYEIFNTNEENILTISEFLKYLIKGQMMEFITPKQKHINKT